MTERRTRQDRPPRARRRELVPTETPDDESRQVAQPRRSKQTVLEPMRTPGRALERAAWRGRNDAEFHPARLVIDDAPGSPIHRGVILVIVALLLSAAAWAYFGRLDSYTSAPGKVQATGRTRVVEALAKGQVSAILAHDGDVVGADAVVVELDPTSAMAARTILANTLTDTRAQVLRLTTEIGAARAETIDPAAKIPWDKDVPQAVRAREDGVARAELAKLAAQIGTLLSQRHAKEAERDKYAKGIDAQKALVAVTQENVTMVESLTKSGYNSQGKYLDMKAQLDDQQVTQTSYQGSLENAKQAILAIDSAIAKARDVFVAAATQTVSTSQQKIVDTSQQLVKADQALANMTLHAPVAGVVHASAVTTIGQVVKSGEQVMQIVPRDGPLEIQVYVSNTDIGFIRKGDAATIKVDAFSYKTYGWVDGTVTDVANDALPLQGKATLQSSSLDGEYNSTSAAQKTGNLQFPVTVRATRSTVTVEGKELPLVPGMGVSVEILTERRRAIDYVLSPLEELFSTAGHERS